MDPSALGKVLGFYACLIAAVAFLAGWLLT